MSASPDHHIVVNWTVNDFVSCVFLFKDTSIPAVDSLRVPDAEPTRELERAVKNHFPKASPDFIWPKFPGGGVARPPARPTATEPDSQLAGASFMPRRVRNVIFRLDEIFIPDVNGVFLSAPAPQSKQTNDRRPWRAGSRHLGTHMPPPVLASYLQPLHNIPSGPRHPHLTKCLSFEH